MFDRSLIGGLAGHAETLGHGPCHNRARNARRFALAGGAQNADFLEGRHSALAALFLRSVKVAITLAFVGSVVAETVASNVGIGYLMIAASSRFNVPLVVAGLMVIAVIGVVIYAITVFLEQLFTGWATRGREGAT